MQDNYQMTLAHLSNHHPDLDTHENPGVVDYDKWVSTGNEFPPQFNSIKDKIVGYMTTPVIIVDNAVKPAGSLVVYNRDINGLFAGKKVVLYKIEELTDSTYLVRFVDYS